VLLDALQRHGKGRLQVCPSDAGLHLAALLDEAVDTPALIERAAMEGINLESLNAYVKDGVAVNGVAFGLGMVDVARIDEGIAKLVRLVA